MELTFPEHKPFVHERSVSTQINPLSSLDDGGL